MAGGLAMSAQAAPAAPLVTPGAIGDTLKQATELQPPAAAPDITPPIRPQAQGGDQGPRITVTQFVFTGNTVFDDAALQPLVAPYLNKPISLGQLYEAADAVAEFYAHKGYTLANVAVPAQKVTGGTVTLEVIEGRVGRIDFDGNHRYHDDVLHSYVSHTQPGQVYQSGPLENDLEILNSLPGLEARAVLKPGSAYGTSDVVIKTHEDLIDGNVVVDNYGRKDTGAFRTSASLTVNNPVGIGDQLQLLGTHSGTNQLDYWYVDYNLPLDTTGLRFDVNYGYAFFQVDVPSTAGGESKLDGKNLNAEADLQQTWLRTTADTLSGSAGFMHTDANANIDGVISAEDTNVNLVNLGVTYSHAWRNAAATQVVASIHTNFNGAKPAADGSPGDLAREKVRAEIDVQHLEPLPQRLQALLQIDAEYSPDALADTEKFSIGGPTSIRGFPASEARGDRGYYTQLTLRRPFVFGRVTLLPRVFFDAGRVVNVDPAGTGDTAETLARPGLGADVLYRTVTLKVDWSYPLDGKPVSDDRNNGRVYAALSAGF
jgi:hemolysin activation/secretion protein